MLDIATRNQIRRDMEEAAREKERRLKQAVEAHSPGTQEACLNRAMEWEELEAYFRERLERGA